MSDGTTTRTWVFAELATHDRPADLAPPGYEPVPGRPGVYRPSERDPMRVDITDYAPTDVANVVLAAVRAAHPHLTQNEQDDRVCVQLRSMGYVVDPLPPRVRRKRRRDGLMDVVMVPRAK